jgi:hypothetical protein
MRARALTSILAIVASLCTAATAYAHYAGDLSYYPGATPKTLCWKLDKDVADNPLWVAWIENATNNWSKVDAGWKFKRCETDEERKRPDIVFSFNKTGSKVDGGAKGGKQGGGPDLGYWRIVIEEDVEGMDINGKKATGGTKGWKLDGETTLDPILVMMHELGHAMGLDHRPGVCDTGHIEDPICAGNHNNPVGRAPSATDVAEVQKGIADSQAKQKAAQQAASSGTAQQAAASGTGQQDTLSGTVTAPACPEKKNHAAIEVGPNGSVGSAARARDKAVSTVLGIAGGFLGGGGGAPAAAGPRLATCRIADRDMTLFEDPASGIALRVAARRNGTNITVFADIARAPERGTFQTAFLENGNNERMAPSDVGICKLWGEWSLSVSWTRTTYVNNQIVSRESGGWARTGEMILPGTLSTVAAPDGIWKRLGFSNASHGAQGIAVTYPAPVATLLSSPVDLVIHVTRPEQSPVTTVPFALRMHEDGEGFVFVRQGDWPVAPGCPT